MQLRHGYFKTRTAHSTLLHVVHMAVLAAVRMRRLWSMEQHQETTALWRE